MPKITGAMSGHIIDWCMKQRLDVSICERTGTVLISRDSMVRRLSGSGLDESGCYDLTLREIKQLFRGRSQLRPYWGSRSDEFLGIDVMEIAETVAAD